MYIISSKEKSVVRNMRHKQARRCVVNEMFFIWRLLLFDGNLSSEAALGFSTIVQKENMKPAAWLKA